MSGFQLGFVFPSDFINSKKPDEFYENEYKLFKEAGYPVYLINIDNLEDSRIYPSLGDHRLLYRGWMVDEDKYQKMFKKLDGQLLVNTEDYLKSHHLPGWYESIKEFTIDSVVTTEADASETYNTLGWRKAFIKDYVKSLKTGKGSIVDSAEDVTRALEDIHKFKGFVEKGIVFRKVVDLEQDTETRFFVLNGQVFSNSANVEMQTLVEKVSQNHNAFFYSVDVVKDKLGNLLIIEIGDGQVSDIVGWELNNFVNIFSSFKSQKKPKS